MKKIGLFERVYRQVRQIPSGKVATYGQVAQKIGIKDSRKVGFSLHANRKSDVPCHRVVNREGGLAKSFGFGGKGVQKQRLLEEGVSFRKDGKVDLKKHLADL